MQELRGRVWSYPSSAMSLDHSMTLRHASAENVCATCRRVYEWNSRMSLAGDVRTFGEVTVCCNPRNTYSDSSIIMRHSLCHVADLHRDKLRQKPPQPSSRQNCGELKELRTSHFHSSYILFFIEWTTPLSAITLLPFLWKKLEHSDNMRGIAAVSTSDFRQFGTRLSAHESSKHIWLHAPSVTGPAIMETPVVHQRAQ
ncbi:hypothetical protein SISSUDRAFT_732448 [Sistotremastrum suecicum HHB10207 ss-3]|uniref:Uncharacterized protein n=1 Tax=Sistotremastrum suecicum HHB10207 ss-3 TaxID=1314776 RepID=A0A165WQC4_9AGAM|nr:hypothetical protein SISSUDRAFT_732448 [Sistotremastrum suecicum HHB10207 ss-3]